MEIIILTGMSGAGKTNAANTLEDLGYYCVDNMPSVMLSEFLRVYNLIPHQNPKVAFVIDIRGESEFDTLAAGLEQLKTGNDCKVIFLDCDDETIIRRYKETRRVHPLTAMKNVPMREAIGMERTLLAAVRSKADVVIETGRINTHQLKKRIIETLTVDGNGGGISVTCMSFGFKYGIPSESDMLFDVRWLPNPFYIPEMRERTGLDSDVSGYVMSFESAADYLRKITDMSEFLLPQFMKEGRMQVVFAVGCTGGKHRSVCFAEKLRGYLDSRGYSAVTLHRDIKKE